MGIIRSKLMRPLKTYNVGHRAEKVISQEKPKSAPYYPSVYEQIKVAKEASPNFIKEHYKKDSELYERLKGVFVTSNMTENPKIKQKEKKTLPFSTITPDAFEFGFWEPKEVSERKCNLRNVIVMLADHITNKEQNSAEILAEKYKLDLKDVENLLEYYRVLQIFEPKRERGIREEDMSLPKMNEKGILIWKSMDQVNKWREEDEKEIEKKRKEEIKNEDQSKLSQVDKQTESPHKDKKTESSHRDIETELSKIDKQKELPK
ncbi:protein NDUFAF4 homolog [Chelonus insularis]|uniref:protein NDUFAF4 homolog n=1 Tax=Chelonus insularis TaxID=460826 RepID=UPI00158C6F8C|nr:protein NDUFAF4 homolog [Chelonus insularis]